MSYRLSTIYWLIDYDIYYETKVHSNFFQDKVCESFLHFLGRVLHNFTFHDHFARFSYVHGLPSDV